MFEPDEFVNIVHEYHAKMDGDGRVAIIPKTPGKTNTAQFWCRFFRQVCVPESNAGCWFRINAVAEIGSGSRGSHKDSDVVRFDKLLVEFDDLSFEQQLAFFAVVKLPILALVHSGRRSIHCILKIPCSTAAEYRAAADGIYDRIRLFGADPSNSNPSRFTRLPGAVRTPPGGEPAMQRLIYLDPDANPEPILEKC